MPKSHTFPASHNNAEPAGSDWVVHGRRRKISSVRVNSADGSQHSGTASFSVAAAVPTPSISSVSPGSYPPSNNNQTMTMGEPWANKYIFPNGMLPSIAQFGNQAVGLFEEPRALCGEYGLGDRRFDDALLFPSCALQSLHGELDRQHVRHRVLFVKPHTIPPIQDILRNEIAAVIGDEFDGPQHELQILLRGIERERQSHPSGFDSPNSAGDLSAVQLRARLVDPQQAMSIRSGARAARSILNPEKMI